MNPSITLLVVGWSFSIAGWALIPVAILIPGVAVAYIQGLVFGVGIGAFAAVIIVERARRTNQ